MSEHFRISVEGEVKVIELLLPDHLDSAAFDQLNERILSAIESSGQGNSWIIDLASVRYMGSAMLGMVVNLRQQIKDVRGKLALVGLSPRLLEVFRTSSMERLFTICRTRADALKRLV